MVRVRAMVSAVLQTIERAMTQGVRGYRRLPLWIQLWGPGILLAVFIAATIAGCGSAKFVPGWCS